MTPDFPTTVQLFQDLWQRTNGERFDGVISIDPVVFVAHARGGRTVDVAGEQISSDNAVKLLLSDAYERFPNGRDSDVFFSEVSRAVFSHLTAGRWDPAEMLDALAKSAEEQRLLLSFTDEQAQQLSRELELDGALQMDKHRAHAGGDVSERLLGREARVSPESVGGGDVRRRCPHDHDDHDTDELPSEQHSE